MNEVENFDEILYISKKRVPIYILASIFIYLVIRLAFFSLPIVGDYIISIYYIIASLCILFLVRSTVNIEGINFYSFISIFYLIVSIISIYNLLPNSDISNKGIGEGVINIITINFTFGYMLLIASLILITRYIDKGENNGIIISSITILIIIISIIFIRLGYRGVVYGLISIINIIYSLIAFKHISNYKLNKKEEINYLYLSVMIFIPMSILISLAVIWPYNYNNANNLIKLMNLISFSISSLPLIDKLINRPYKTLFRDIYEKNTDMNEINKKIVAKNRELQFSQIIAKKKDSMLKILFRNVPVPLAIVNSNNSRIIYANPNFLSLISAKKISDVINKRLFSIIKVEDDPYGGEISIDGESKIYRGELLIENKLKYIDLEFIDNINENGETIVIFNNVTTKVAVDKIKETMQNKMMEERLKSDFLSNISHDLKTPINVIYSATQLNEYFIDQNNTEGLKKYNVISKHNCVLLIKLTNNLIDSSKILSDFLSVNLKRRNIVQVVEDTVMGLTDYTKGKEIELIFDTNEEEIYIMLDEDFMQRILLNVLSNAIKFTPNGGKIKVVVEDLGDYEVKVYIKDNGIGMDPGFLENAFSRYSMGKNNEKSKEKGTGIGLFVVKKLIEKQNGRINIISKVGEGTCIELTFMKGYEYEY